MAAPLNDRDVRLQATAPRYTPIASATNGLNVFTVMIYHRAASNTAPTLPSANVTVNFATGAVTGLTNGWSSTIDLSAGRYLFVSSAVASAATPTDTIAPGEWSAANLLASDGTSGASASLLTLTPTAQAITYNGAGVATPANQTISFTANLQNLVGTAAFACSIYNAAGTSLGAITMGGTGNTRTLTDAQFTTAASYAVVTASAGGFSDVVSVVRLADGAGAMAGYLTNENVTVPTASDGSNAVLTGVTGSFKVFQGTTDVTAGCTFAIVGSPVVTAAAPTNGTGAYSVTGTGTWANASMTTTVNYRATHTASGATIDKALTITKAPSGGAGTGARGAGHYYAVGSAWSDTLADSTVPSPKVVNDQVTISNSTTFTLTKRWDGSTWYVPGTYMDGSLFVTGTIVSSAIDTRGMVIRDAAGNGIIGLNVPLTRANLNITIGGDNLCNNSSFERHNGSVPDGFTVYNNNVSGEPSTTTMVPGRTGGQAYQITWASGHTSSKGLYGNVCLGGWIPGKTYIISFWAKSSSLTSTSGCFLGWNTNPASVTPVSNPALSAAWQRYAFLVVMAGSVELNGFAFMSVEVGAGPGTVQFDDIMVVEGDYLPAYSQSTAEAATMSTWAGTTGVGKPADNASSDITLIARGGISIAGNTATKTGGAANAWDADVYSKDGYVGGALAQVTVVNAAHAIMFGLNTDPTTDSSFGSIDYALWVNGGGSIGCWESNVQIGTIGSYVTGDILAVSYDGSNVRYLRNGAVQRIVPAVITSPLFFDSSFASFGGALSNIRFGPLSSNAWGSIGGVGKPENYATVGAPAGTMVGNTEAQTVAQRSYDAVVGLDDKLSKTSATALAATVTIATGGSVLAGTTSNGTYLSPSGLFCVQGGVVTVSIPISGSPAFKGNISGSSGTFSGSLTASQVITTDNMVGNSITTTDIFSSGLPAPGYAGVSFVVTRTSKVLVIAKFSADGSNFWVGDSSSNQVGNASGNYGEYAIIPMTLGPGTYYAGTNFGGASYAYILKVMV